MAGDPLQAKRQEWDAIFSDPELSIQSLRQRVITGKVCHSGLRSVCWKVFMEYFTSMDFSSWPAVQAEHRQRYADLKTKYIDEPARRMTEKADDVTDNNPLALSENNPWQQYFADLEIRKVIRQDVDRTFPDIEFFRSEQIQERMTDILFVYCKLNHDVSYRQGMHELLAPLYWTLATESIDLTGGTGPADSTNKLLAQMLDAAHVEHDAYVLFEKLMQFAKPWYEFSERSSGTRSARNSTSGYLRSDTRLQPSKNKMRLNPVLMSCQRIQNEYLRTVDPVLYQHLESSGIEPQLYGMRWLRLLFGREFEFHDLLKLWDAIFAQDHTLKIVEYVCVALLLRMRDKLLAGDYAECLTLLMRGAQFRNPATLVQQAQYLHDNLSEHGGLHILQQNDLQSGKPPRASLWDGNGRPDPAAELRTSPSNRIKHRKSHGANLDGLASITRGVMKSPQVRDLNKAIAGVMGTVQKNVNMLGDNLRARDVDSPPFRRRLTVSSEFPAGVERQAQYTTTTNNGSSSSSRISQSPQAIRQSMIPSPIERPPREDSLISSFKATNRQMGDVLAKCIDILETEIFSDKQNAPSEPKQDDDNGETKEKTEAAKNKVSGSEPDQANLIGALAGLKHVRDVLCGKQTLFDPAVIQTFFENNKKDETRSSFSEWDVVSYDDHEADQEKGQLRQQAEGATPVPAQTATHLDYEKTKASPPIKTEEMTQQPGSAPNTRSPPKQHVIYSIEDLLADPSLQTVGVEKSDKFQWISAVEDNDLFSQPKRPTSLRKYSSSHSINHPRPASTSAVDPLDAKNVDKKKAYEYDIF